MAFFRGSVYSTSGRGGTSRDGARKPRTHRAARFSTLLQLTERDNLGKSINDAMKAIEEENEELRGILPRTYTALENATLVELLKLMASIPMDIEGDALRHTYASLLIAAGKELHYIQQQLGHHSPAFTLSVYGHLLPRDRCGEVNCLDDSRLAPAGEDDDMVQKGKAP